MCWVVVVMALLTAGCGVPASSEPVAPQRVTLRGVTVEAVPTDTGFWARTIRDDLVWVKLDLTGRSAMPVQRGERIDVTGVVVPHGPGFAAREGLAAGRDAELLTRLGTHVEADQSDVRVVPDRQVPAPLAA